MTARSRRTARGMWRDYGLSITLALLFFGAWTLQPWTGWVEFVADQAALGQPAEAFGNDGAHADAGPDRLARRVVDLTAIAPP
jgi:hypothetical protein